MSDELPEPNQAAAERGYKTYDGFHWEWERDLFLHWKIRTHEDERRCRHTDHGHRCESVGVVAINRGGMTRPQWWWYCADHTFGRVIHDGSVWSLVLREDEPIGGAS